MLSTLAGSTTPGSANGTGGAAEFNDPFGLAMSTRDPSRLFVADQFNHMVRVVR